jgi:hypothetical protein
MLISFRIPVAALLLAGLVRASSAQTAARPFLYPLFTDHMVLQRDAATAIWGWTEPGKEVTVTLTGRSARAVADAKIDGDDVVVSSPQISEPKFLRYDYVDVPRCRLWNKAGLAAAPFETRLTP